MNLLKLSICAFGLLLTSSLQLACGDELKELQGKWEMKWQSNGHELRTVKTIEGNTETVESYDGTDLVHRHVVKFEVSEKEGICVIKYDKAETTHGPNKGSIGGPGSFISKRYKEYWLNIFNAAIADEFPLRVEPFARIADEKLASQPAAQTK